MARSGRFRGNLCARSLRKRASKANVSEAGVSASKVPRSEICSRRYGGTMQWSGLRLRVEQQVWVLSFSDKYVAAIEYLREHLRLTFQALQADGSVKASSPPRVHERRRASNIYIRK